MISHQGSVRTKSRARLIVYWPGLDNDLDNIVHSCKHCQERLLSLPKEPILLKPKPTWPFQEIARDFCTHAAHKFLIIVDCFSDWPEIIHMGTNTTTPRLLTALKQTFCHSGAPDIVWSDRGPQFTSRFFYGVGLPAQHVYRYLPPEQRQSRSGCEVHEEVDPSSLDRLTG